MEIDDAINLLISVGWSTKDINSHTEDQLLEYAREEMES